MKYLLKTIPRRLFKYRGTVVVHPKPSGGGREGSILQNFNNKQKDNKQGANSPSSSCIYIVIIKPFPLHLCCFFLCQPIFTKFCAFFTPKERVKVWLLIMLIVTSTWYPKKHVYRLEWDDLIFLGEAMIKKQN